MSIEHPPLSSITAHHITWKNQAWLALFERLLALYPKAFLPDSPKPLALSVREELLVNLETIMQDMPLKFGKKTLHKVVKSYLRTEAYLQALIEGEQCINLQGEIEGEVTYERREFAKHVWWKLYDSTRVVTPPSPAKPKIPPPNKTLQLKKQPKPVKRAVKKNSGGNKSSQPGSPRMRGTITHYVEDRGFGFLSLLEGGPRIFFHKNAMKQSQLDTQQLIGRRVTFRVIPGKSGPNSFSAIQIQFDDI
ncbi:MAG: cold shock domain-containing protein [Gammaproteobacteria bacterium]|nr:cold shock domain-containing protein [Gammaproteobacteria bacterium]